jgi:hypothetical protein
MPDKCRGLFLNFSDAYPIIKTVYFLRLMQNQIVLITPTAFTVPHGQCFLALLVTMVGIFATVARLLLAGRICKLHASLFKTSAASHSSFIISQL